MGRCFLMTFIKLVSPGWYVVTRGTRCVVAAGGVVGLVGGI